MMQPVIFLTLNKTMFGEASLQPSEDGTLPEMIQLEGRSFFRVPDGGKREKPRYQEAFLFNPLGLG